MNRWYPTMNRWRVYYTSIGFTVMGAACFVFDIFEPRVPVTLSIVGIVLALTGGLAFWVGRALSELHRRVEELERRLPPPA